MGGVSTPPVYRGSYKGNRWIGFPPIALRIWGGGGMGGTVGASLYKFFQHPVSTQLVPTPDRHQSSTEKVKKKPIHQPHSWCVWRTLCLAANIDLYIVFLCTDFLQTKRKKLHIVQFFQREQELGLCSIGHITRGENCIQSSNKTNGDEKQKYKIDGPFLNPNHIDARYRI